MSKADYNRGRKLAEDGNEPPSPLSPPSPKSQTLTAVVSSRGNETLAIYSQASKDEANTYYAQVEQAFMGEPQKVEDFRTLLVNFKVKGEPNLAVVISTVKKLFRGHEQLIVGFNVYLPEDMKITLPLSEDDEPDSENPQLQDEMEELIVTETKVKRQGESPSRREMIEFFKKAQADLPKDGLRSFRETLHCFFESNRSTQDVQELLDDVAVQFKDRRNLLAEFLGFFPERTVSTIRATGANPPAKTAEDPSRNQGKNLLVGKQSTELSVTVSENNNTSPES